MNYFDLIINNQCFDIVQERGRYSCKFHWFVDEMVCR